MDNVPISNFFISEGDKLIFIYDFLNYWTFFVELYDLDDIKKIDKDFNILNSIGEVPDKPPSNIFDSTKDSNDIEFDDNYTD